MLIKNGCICLGPKGYWPSGSDDGGASLSKTDRMVLTTNRSMHFNSLGGPLCLSSHLKILPKPPSLRHDQILPAHGVLLSLFLPVLLDLDAVRPAPPRGHCPGPRLRWHGGPRLAGSPGQGPQLLQPRIHSGRQDEGIGPSQEALKVRHLRGIGFRAGENPCPWRLRRRIAANES